MQNQILRRTVAAKANGQVLSSEGGRVYQVDPFTVLRRFLILGSTGTFYNTAANVTDMAVKDVDEAIKADPHRVRDMVVEVRVENLALKGDPALYVLARLTLPDVPLDVRRDAADLVKHLCRTGTDLLHWVAFRKGMGKSNTLFRRAITQWFMYRSPGQLALQAVKYDQRDGWTLRDALRLAKPNVEKELGPQRASDIKMIVDWITHPNNRVPWDGRQVADEDAHRLLAGYSNLREGPNGWGPKEYGDYIAANRTPREAIPAPLLKHREVWEALWPQMPAQAFVRNLGKLTSLDIFKGEQDAAYAVEKIHAAARKLHPFAFLIARKVYEQGHGDKGNLSWKPQPMITIALEEAFGEAFPTLTINESIRPLVALDISGSMSSVTAGTNLTNYEAETALAMVLAYQYPRAEFVWFSAELAPFAFEGNYGEALQYMESLGRYMGGTFLDLPLAYVEDKMRKGDGYDAVVTITDNETHSRKELPADIIPRIHRIHPEFRHAVVAMATNRISVANPNDPLQMDFVGLDASLPVALEGFLSRTF